MEPLEPRTLMFAWSAQEVYFAELVNRARANPAAEAQRLGLDFSAGLNYAEQQLLVPHEPLAFDPALTAAARAHSADMAARAFFDHVNPDMLSPTMRAQLECHQLGAPDKETWNLEPWRPDVSAVDMIAARCNPS